MNITHSRFPVLWFLLFALVYLIPTGISAEPPQRGFHELQRHPAKTAHQGVAVDANSIFSISSREISRHQKPDGKLLDTWKGPKDSHIRHLNSGVVIQGKLYCAHSNWPQKPLKNTVEVFDAKNLKHLETLKFPETPGPSTGLIDARENGGSPLRFTAS